MVRSRRRSMEALDHDEIKLGGIGHNIKDVSNIIKGKRTKRQRHQSPIPITATHSSSSHHPIPSPVTSSEFPAGSSAATTTTTTDEDEDTAMCLILLSKGFSSQEKLPKVEIDDFSVTKFSSKKYLQPSAAAANGTAGIYVFECKTCNRTFPSFQALGGHRTSHKRPKIAIDSEEKKSPLMAFSDEEPPPPPLQPESSIKRNPSSSSSLSLQLSTRPLFGNPNNKSPKIHECSICGAEFISGQALGGHMRRHRLLSSTTATATATTTTTTSAATTTLSLLPNSPIETEIEDEKMSRNDGLCLDLNLPAPEDHDHHQSDSKFPFKSKQELPPSLVMSTRPTLVDCHY